MTKNHNHKYPIYKHRFMKWGLLFFLIVFLLFPYISYAFMGLDVDLECDELAGTAMEKRKELCKTLEVIAYTIKIMAAVIALIVIVIGGVILMTAGGSEDKLGKGKKTLLYGLLGAAVVFASSFIINLLNEIVPK